MYPSSAALKDSTMLRAKAGEDAAAAAAGGCSLIESLLSLFAPQSKQRDEFICSKLLVYTLFLAEKKLTPIGFCCIRL